MALLNTIGLTGRTKGMRRGQPRSPRAMFQFLFRGLAAILLVLLAAPWRISAAESATSPEYQVKAVFLSKFPSFVTWPDNVFSDAKAPIVIGIFGSDPFGPHLQEAIRGVEIKGRSLAI